MKKRILLIFLVAIVLSSCGISGSSSSFDDVREKTSDGIVYETFYIEGMPCMRIGRGVEGGVWEYDGVTCDWSRWKGN